MQESCNAEPYQLMNVPHDIFSILCPDSEIISKLSLATQSRLSPSFGVYLVYLIAVNQPAHINQPLSYTLSMTLAPIGSKRKN